MKTFKHSLPVLLLMARLGSASTATAAPVSRAGYLSRVAVWLARRLLPSLALLALAAGSSHASVSDTGVGTLTKASAHVYISEWDGYFRPVFADCSGEGACTAPLYAAYTSASPDFGAIDGNAWAWASVGTGVYSPMGMGSAGEVRSAWLDTYTVSSSTLPVGTPVTLTLRLDLWATLQAAVAVGDSLCGGTGAGNSSACAQGFAAFCASYDNCYYTGQWPALVRPSLNAPGTLLTATDLLQTWVGVTGAQLTGQLVFNAGAGVRKPGLSSSADAVASARYYVDAPSGVTLTWASGHNYAAPVPLPASWPLMLGGLAAARGLTKRRGMKATACS